MNFKKITFFAVIFWAAITGNIGAQEQSDTNEQADLPAYFFNFQPLPALNVFGYNAGLISVQSIRLSGIYKFSNVSGMDGYQAGRFLNVAKDVAKGIQSAGDYDYVLRKLFGYQVSDIINLNKGNMWGIQFAPVNLRGEGNALAVQVDLINSSETGSVVPIGGLVTQKKGSLGHFWVFTDDMLFLVAGYRTGSGIFYAHSNIGIGGAMIGREGDRLMSYRGGFGLEFPIGKFFIDIDFSIGDIFKVDEGKDLLNIFFGFNTGLYQIRLIGGYKIYERLAVFFGISYDFLLQRTESDPSPGGFIGAGLGKTYGNNTHKVGFFGGLQF